MQQLFLTSEVKLVAKDLVKKMRTKSGSFKTAYITTPIEKGHEGDDLAWHRQNKKSMKDAGFDIFEYSITGKNLESLKHDLRDIDIVYVEGGSLVHMLNQSRLSGFDTFVRIFVESGGIYIGTSTGSFILAENTAPGLCLEDYFEDGFDSNGIGLVNFLVMPHWGTKEFKEKYAQFPTHAYNMKVPMIVLSDTQYVWVQGEDMRIVDVL